jgi:hypothetical protein
LLDRVVKRDAAFVHQHQCHHGGDQLGVRVGSVDAVGPQRLALLDVGLTEAERVDHIGALEYQRRHTGQPVFSVMAQQHGMRRGKSQVGPWAMLLGRSGSRSGRKPIFGIAG